MPLASAALAGLFALPALPTPVFASPAAENVPENTTAVQTVVATDAVTAYNDCALGFFLLMLFYALVVWRQEGGDGWSAVIGALAGFCVAVKLTAVFAAAGAAGAPPESRA